MATNSGLESAGGRRTGGRTGTDLAGQEDEEERMPTAAVVRVTSSWDDGHSNDVRVVEILRRHGGKGTFFIYRVNYVLYTKDPTAALRTNRFYHRAARSIRHELSGHGNRRARVPPSGYAQADAEGVVG